MNLYEKYINSKFYKKYKDTYYSDSLLKEYFNKLDRRKKRLIGIGKCDYNELVNKNIYIINELFELFIYDIGLIDKEEISKMIYSIYVDPDSKAIKKYGDIYCYCDGLISIKKICVMEHNLQSLTEVYKEYRKKPIIFFPSEYNGINISRKINFGDRIDHTLFDLKNYFEDNKYECYLEKSYNLPLTNKWLNQFSSFKELVDSMHLKGIFTNDNYYVFDLEKNDGSIICEYSNSYPKKWSEDYYNNLKVKIKEFDIYNSKI